MQVFERTKALFDSGEWMQIFSAIDFLRTLNKYHGEGINLLFQAFGSYIRDAAGSPKPSI